MKTEARDKFIISRKAKSREENRRELMQMSEEDIKRIFESYEFINSLGHPLTHYVLF